MSAGFCPGCGAPLQIGAITCGKCGRAVTAAPAQIATQVMMVAPKSAGIALLASFFIPGLGTMMNGAVGKGVTILLLYIVSLALIFAVVGLLTTPIIWIWGMVDAYSGAKNWNTQHGIIS